MKNKIEEIKAVVSTAIHKATSSLGTDDLQVLVYEEDGEIVIGVDLLKPCDKSLREHVLEAVRASGCKNIEVIGEDVLPSEDGFRVYANAS